MKYDYERFLQTLIETKGIHNSLNEILKYDYIYHSNKIEGSTFTTEALQMLMEKNIVTGTHTLDDVQKKNLEIINKEVACLISYFFIITLFFHL